MSEPTADGQSANGTAPAPEAAPEDQATGGEKALAVLGVLFGIFLIVMAIDMGTGGRVLGYIQERAPRD